MERFSINSSAKLDLIDPRNSLFFNLFMAFAEQWASPLEHGGIEVTPVGAVPRFAPSIPTDLSSILREHVIAIQAALGAFSGLQSILGSRELSPSEMLGDTGMIYRPKAVHTLGNACIRDVRELSEMFQKCVLDKAPKPTLPKLLFLVVERSPADRRATSLAGFQLSTGHQLIGIVFKIAEQWEAEFVHPDQPGTWLRDNGKGVVNESDSCPLSISGTFAAMYLKAD